MARKKNTETLITDSGAIDEAEADARRKQNERVDEALLKEAEQFEPVTDDESDDE